MKTVAQMAEEATEASKGDFDVSLRWLNAYTALVRAQALEEAAQYLDEQHEMSKHLHNYAACYAVVIRAMKGEQ